jgi:hypothetical protein
MDLLQDPLLAPHFVWDAQRLYKHDGTHFERFIHEPWTADRWWEVQVCMYLLYHYAANRYIFSAVFIVSTTKQRRPICVHTLCGQNSSDIIWQCEGVSSNCSVRKSACWHKEW